MTRALEAPEIRQRLADRGFDVVASSPDQFLAFVRSESDRLGKIIRDNKIQPNESRNVTFGRDG